MNKKTLLSPQIHILCYTLVLVNALHDPECQNQLVMLLSESFKDRNLPLFNNLIVELIEVKMVALHLLLKGFCFGLH